jgi:hypothetical protein
MSAGEKDWDELGLSLLHDFSLVDDVWHWRYLQFSVIH